MTARVWSCVGEYFIQHLLTRGSATALWESRGDQLRGYTWGDIAAVVAEVIRSLEKHELQSGAHIATWMPNSLAWIAVDLAAQLRGFVHVALDSRLPQATAMNLAQHASASVLFTTDDRVNHLRETLGESCTLQLMTVDTHVDHGLPMRFEICFDTKHRPAPEALAQILYTSGTMSEPKGVMLSHRNLLVNALAKLGAAPQFIDDVRLNILPFAHAYARTCELSTWIIGGSQICLARDWANLLELALKVRPTLINLVPHLAHKLVCELDRATAEGLSERSVGERVLGDRLRLLQVGGAALRLDVWNRLVAAGWPPLQGYGLTETSPVICSNRAGEQRPETVGRPVDGVELHVDERGVLWTRGPHVMLGYWQAPAETAAKVKDGWLCTEDVAQVSSDGHWRILGRIDDQITLSTGYKALPFELSGRLMADAWIDQLVIVGQDRPHLAALVHPRLDALPRQLFDRSDVSGFDDNVSETDKSKSCDMAQLNERRFEEALVQRWSPVLADLPRQLRIERIGVLREKLTSDSGGLNFKGGIRRKHIEQVLLAVEVARLYDPTALTQP